MVVIYFISSFLLHSAQGLIYTSTSCSELTIVSIYNVIYIYVFFFLYPVCSCFFCSLCIYCALSNFLSSLLKAIKKFPSWGNWHEDVQSRRNFLSKEMSLTHYFFSVCVLFIMSMDKLKLYLLTKSISQRKCLSWKHQSSR